MVECKIKKSKNRHFFAGFKLYHKNTSIAQRFNFLKVPVLNFIQMRFHSSCVSIRNIFCLSIYCCNK